MRTIVDLHMHSHYSRATSKHLTVAGIAEAARLKGVDVIATGDITHPRWLEEIARDVVEDGSGLLRLHDSDSPARFVLFGEVSSIYKKDDITRRVHTLFGVSSVAAARRVNKKLVDLGYNIAYDGRPIIGMDVAELAKIYLDADPQALIIPAHIWTPWFSLFGSKSGFHSVAECFGDMTQHVYAIETGLSSDPAMNWRVSDLNNLTITSNSDAHSPEKVGREATVFNWPECSYQALYDALRHNSVEYTIEFYPAEGKYHLDGHRNCGVVFTPEQTRAHKGICPKCGLPVVVGVLSQVETLADQTAAHGQYQRPPFKSIVPLPEIIANCYGVGVSSKKVQRAYRELIDALGNEFHILLGCAMQDIQAAAEPIIAEGIRRVRAGQLHIQPGYDGVFGVVEVFSAAERATFSPHQQGLNV